jgi:hypothetical protein
MPTVATKINRKAFFDRVRKSFFNGKLSQLQVDGMNAIIDEWERRELDDLRWLAYICATVYHESAKTFQAINESGTEAYFNRRYGPQTKVGKLLGNTNVGDGARFRGRGMAQITGRANYEKFGIADHPEKALELETATTILFDGMIKGVFTGRKLVDYFNDKKSDWLNARKIINSLDQAFKIGTYGTSFYKCLNS